MIVDDQHRELRCGRGSAFSCQHGSASGAPAVPRRGRPRCRFAAP
jgi:hypothetical protein